MGKPFIDVTARAIERDTYRPMFHLTEVDRRKDRKVVLRPNDGPGDMAVRRALARERLAKLEAKRERLALPKSRTQITEERNERVRQVILQTLIEHGGSLLLGRIWEINDLPVDAVEKQVLGMDANGLVEKSRSAKDGGGYNGLVTITDAGRDYLEEVAP
jgi:hypothetical protein